MSGDLCQQCKEASAEPLHACPYQDDVAGLGIEDFACNCCPECERGCVMEI